MKKKVLSILVAVVVLFALCACNGNSDLIKKIEELESTVQSQSDKISELEGENKQQSDKMSELEEQNKQQADKITDLEEKIEELEEQNLELKMQASVHSGEFCDLVTAYGNGWLTQDDIRNIACFHGGNTVIEGQISNIDTWHEVEFVPTKKESFLSEAAKNSVKEAYAYYLRNNDEHYPDITAKSVNFCDYYGTYNNCVVVRIFAVMDNSGGMSYGVGVGIDDIISVGVGGIILHCDWPRFIVWKMI